MEFSVLDLDPVSSLRSRVRTAVYSVSGSTSNITGTAKKSYETAVEEFESVYAEIKALVKEFEAFDKKLNELGAPTTPGRFPDWKQGRLMTKRIGLARIGKSVSAILFRRTHAFFPRQSADRV
ncbi:MAG: hypothetical protein U9N72_04295 [Bacteroidota bacterium]|nr:hypothetical protein [Bacteroidota bacterium]